MAKIAFNYLAYAVTQRSHNAALLLHRDFDRVREFVRGNGNDEPRFHLNVMLRFQDPQKDGPEGHLAAVSWDHQTADVVATVSLFSTMVWQVELARSFRQVAPEMASAHFWSIANRSVKRIRARFHRVLSG